MAKKEVLLLLFAATLAGCSRYHLTMGGKAHDRMAYADAVRHYTRVPQEKLDRDAVLRLADAFRRQHLFAPAAQWYGYADRLHPLDADQALTYGRLLRTMNREREAKVQFERALVQRPDDPMIRTHYESITDRARFFEDTTLFTVRPIDLQGFTNVFAACPRNGGIVFAGEKAASAGHANPWNGLSFLDLYTASPTGDERWSAPQALPGEVNGRYHDGPASFSADGREMYLTRSDYYRFRLNKDERSTSHLKLFRATLGPDGRWGDLHLFAQNGDNFSTGHAALNATGDVLYLISDRPGGYGGTDLYRCARTSDGWGTPVNLGPTVNTTGNEMFPTVHGDTLWFASDGHPGLGGLDILFSIEGVDGWSVPENPGYPLNTAHDDFALTMLPGGREGYLSSDRTGSDRIHRFTVNDPTLVVMGTFLGEDDGLPMAGVEVRLLEPATGEELVLFTADDGRYSFQLKPGREYRLSGGRDGMFTESRDLRTAGQRTSRTWREDFRLKKVVIDKPMVVENIFYDLDRWDIRPDAALELDKLARLFLDNPGLSFELSAHTDSRAGDLYNLVLSEARAKSAVDYLVRKGVDPARIAARGYGETRLVNHCQDGVECTEEEHQANRRTEFKVTRAMDRTP